MNQLIETFMMKFDGQAPEFILETNKGYKFTAFIQNTFTNSDNFDDFTSDERIIKMSFDIKVPGYIIAPEHPGLPSPYRRFVSAPQINFDVWEQNAPLVTEPDANRAGEIIDKFTLTDVSVLNNNGNEVTRRGEENLRVIENIQNPFDGQTQAKYLKVTSRVPKAGETILTAQKIRKIDTID